MDLERELLDNSLDVLDDVFYIYDRDARLVYWNRRLNELFGLTDGELRGMRPFEFFLEEDRQDVEQAVGGLFETGETVVEARAETTEGLIRFQLSGRLLTDGDGSVVGFSGIGRDVTRSYERERRLARQNERLDQFVSVVSHDLRNPLTVLDGSLVLAEETGDPAAFERCRETLQRMGALVEDLLTLARKGAWVEETTPVQLATVAAETWANVDTGAATLSVESEQTIVADEGRLQQLLENLYRNAFEHGSDPTRPAGDDMTVTVGDRPDGFYVADDGIGISMDEYADVFEDGYTSTADGTGLGLNIVEQIATAHDWSIAVEESDDGGARFEISGVTVV